MSQKNRILLIVAQVEINKILKEKNVSELSNKEKIILSAYLKTMKNIYKSN